MRRDAPGCEKRNRDGSTQLCNSFHDGAVRNANEQPQLLEVRVGVHLVRLHSSNRWLMTGASLS